VSGAADRLPRLLALVPWLLAHPGARLAEVAGEFGVPVSQVVDDLRLIWMCGLPGQKGGDLIDVEIDGADVLDAQARGDGRVRIANADAIARPLRLTSDEALALITVLRTFRDAPGLTDTGPVDRALAKLEGAAGEAAELAGRVSVAVETGEQVGPVVRDALARGRRLHLRYYVPARDEPTERDVDPIRLLAVAGQTYLQAWCHRAEGVRRFRLDRVLDVRVLDAPAEPPREAPVTELDGGLYAPAPDDPVVVLDLAPEARWVAEYYPVDAAEELGEGRLRVQLRAADDRWVVRLALRLGMSLRVIEPAELAERVRAQAAAALAAYESVN
jgi:proteasome accessory factor C